METSCTSLLLQKKMFFQFIIINSVEFGSQLWDNTWLSRNGRAVRLPGPLLQSLELRFRWEWKMRCWIWYMGKISFGTQRVVSKTLPGVIHLDFFPHTRWVSSPKLTKIILVVNFLVFFIILLKTTVYI